MIDNTLDQLSGDRLSDDVCPCGECAGARFTCNRCTRSIPWCAGMVEFEICDLCWCAEHARVRPHQSLGDEPASSQALMRS